MNTESIRSEWVGQVIDGRFTLLQWLGGSESSGVFLTELQENRSQKAAIKLMLADDVEAEAHLSGWEVTKTLSHPHLLPLLHTGSCQIETVRLLYAVTEFAEENLSQILPERPLTPIEARQMLNPVLDVLSYLHGKGLVHGHLKPANIMVVEDGLKLSSDNLHVAGQLGKTFAAPGPYDAPEGAIETISPAADIWSLGVTLVEALTQHPPAWDRSTLSEPIVPESIPQPFADIARECLRSNPERRCTLGRVESLLEPASSVPDQAVKVGRTVPGKLRATTLVAAVLVLLAIVTALKMRSHQAQPSLPTGEQQPVPAIAVLTPQNPVPEIPRPEGEAVKGAVDERVLPDVPQSASQTIRGKVNVSIRVTVNPSGEVSNAALDSPAMSKYFANLALNAARSWRFKPAQVEGQAVSSVWVLRFEFLQTGTETAAVEVSP